MSILKNIVPKKFRAPVLSVKLFIDDYIYLRFKSPSLPAPTIDQIGLISELRIALSKIKNNSASTTWRGFSTSLRNYSRFLDPRRFLRWHVIRQTMFMARAWQECIDELKKDPQWQNIWKPLVAEDAFGDPIPDPNMPESSGNRLVHAFHLLMLKRVTGISFEKLDRVVEFGGGYGSMCRLIRRLGFKGTYVLYDLPEFLALQHFYLNGVGNRAVYAQDFDEHAQNQNVLVEDPKSLALVLAKISGTQSLFIGTWSVSESPVSVREMVLPQVANSTYFLFGYQPHFDTVDNVDYFRNFASAHPQVTWTELFTDIWNGYYLFGKKK